MGAWKASNSIFTESNVWVYCATTMDSSGNLIFYKNGESAGTDTGTLENNDKDLYIGNRFGGSMAAHFFNGTISSVRIYNRALTPLEIWNSYVTMKPYIPLSESPVAIV